MEPPQHPGNPKWQNMSEWVKMKPPTSIDYIKNEAETLEESFERFGLTQETGDWGDASKGQDSWGGVESNTDKSSGW
ncbi:hypothetical protein HPULCUR_009388 [Helicostylum pulchrum]|uniref:Uncharacterized protein n=1 Tax=Helicostylum pulchrum TaxID=562976 RepID=A0ABP9YBD7_9FUNG